eukprot:TRINITY_DN2898_c0_g1_i2.p1 TRINITY_DN2898_c0_g1~~TRINITY_DN2898_c0_g1_i2.p1  ORF type:complete len:500 (+),score=101.11 TRINITY_DN2898_c0_g1_i2:1710-3209(+)
MVKFMYPDDVWVPWKFGRVSHGFWLIEDNQRMFVDWLQQELKLKDDDDWYNVTSKIVSRNYGKYLMTKLYNNSVYSMLKKIKSHNNWNEERFIDYFDNHLVDDVEQFRWLETKLNINNSPDDWYKITKIQLKSIPNGDKYLKKHGDSILSILTKHYPDTPWFEWLIDSKLPRSFWNNKQNVIKYIEWFKKIKNIQSMEDWYNVSPRDFALNHGSTIIRMYNYSPFLLLKDVYQDFNWKPWLFERTPKNTWKSVEYLMLRVKELESILGIEKLDDWYRISSIDLSKIPGALSMTRKFPGGLYGILSLTYPLHQWDRQLMLDRGKKSSQRWLLTCLKKLFPNHKIYEDFAFDGYHDPLENIKTTETSTSPSTSSTLLRTLEYDIWIPTLSLAFEYQGEQHYSTVIPWSTNADYTSRDKLKIKLSSERKITLIQIPFWWDRKVSSLSLTITQYRPDLIPIITKSHARGKDKDHDVDIHDDDLSDATPIPNTYKGISIAYVET